MEDLDNISTSKILESATGEADIHPAEEADAVNHLEPIEIFLEQPDGSKVRISFLASGEIEGGPQILPQIYELSPNVEEPSSSLVNKSSDLLTSFVTSETAQQMSAIQTPDGQIYYIESYPSAKNGKDPQGEQPVFYTLLPKDLYAASESEPLIVSTENVFPNETTKDNVYSIAREKLKPFVTVNKTRRRAESSITQIGGDLHLEDKMAAMAALLPAPANKRPAPKPAGGAGADGASAYKCDMCDASYDRAAQYYGHSKAHTEERRLRCVRCRDDKVFAAHSQLMQHERQFHVSVRAHKCPLCDASFERPSQLANHERRIHMQERPNRCAVCDKSFFKLSDLRSHLNIHFGLDVKVCDTCGKRFNHVSNLNRHLRTHTGVRPFVCPTCGRRFVQQSGLAFHEQTHKPGQLVACPLCGKELKNKATLRSHLRVKHNDAADNKGDGPTGVHRPRKFYCRVCGRDFPYAVLLKNHEATHSAQAAFHCSWCGQDLGSVELLKSHPCQSAGQRARQATAEQEAERATLQAQMDRLLGPSPAEPGGPGADDIVVYITQDGSDTPTQVLITPVPGRYLPAPAAPAAPAVDTEDTAEQCALAELVKTDLARMRFEELGLRLDGETNLVGGDMPSLTRLEGGGRLEGTDGRLEGGDDKLEGGDGRLEGGEGRLEGENRRLEGGDGRVEGGDGRLKGGNRRLEGGNRRLEGGGRRREDFGGVDVKKGFPRKAELALEECSRDVELVVTDVPAEAGDELKTMDVTITVLADGGTAGPAIAPAAKSAAKSAAKIYCCPEPGCCKVFFKNGSFKQHLGLHYAEEKRHLCPVCGESFAWQSTMCKHLLKHEPANERRMFACHVCRKQYLFAAQVQNHIKRDHEKERPHACSTCSKSFFKKHDLTIHLRTHTKEMPYMCRTCGKRFSHASHIIRHELIHSGHRPHACPDCGRRFTQSNSLKAHRSSQACKPAAPTDGPDRTVDGEPKLHRKSAAKRAKARAKAAEEGKSCDRDAEETGGLLLKQEKETVDSGLAEFIIANARRVN